MMAGVIRSLDPGGERRRRRPGLLGPGPLAMDNDTTMGGRQGAFPATRRSVVMATGSPDPAVRQVALDGLVKAYWKPVYKYIRIRWSADNEDAKDLTQEFFARLMERGDLERYDPARALFRTYLRTCVDGFVANQRKAAGRIKRGGARSHISLDFQGAEEEFLGREIADGRDLDAFFHQEWVRAVFALAVDALNEQGEAQGKTRPFALFERLDLDGPDTPGRPSYAQLGEEFGMSVTQVANDLAHARREFRRLVLEKLRESCGSEEEFRAEARQLLGIDPR
jgi:RNA polymerase sigma factor (sigma-70 family)